VAGRWHATARAGPRTQVPTSAPIHLLRNEDGATGLAAAVASVGQPGAAAETRTCEGTSPTTRCGVSITRPEANVPGRCAKNALRLLIERPGADAQTCEEIWPPATGCSEVHPPRAAALRRTAADGCRRSRRACTRRPAPDRRAARSVRSLERRRWPLRRRALGIDARARRGFANAAADTSRVLVSVFMGGGWTG